MPTPSAFLRGFGLTRGTSIGGYTLTSVHSTHEEIERYREYYYAFTLTFIAHEEANRRNLVREITSITSQTHIVNSQYGNPYECVIDEPSRNDFEGTKKVTVYLDGHS